MNTNIKQFLASFFALLLMIANWLVFYTSCLSLASIFAMIFILSYGYIQKAKKKKECFRECYLKNDTLISKIFMSAFAISIFYVALSITYTGFIAYELINFDTKMYMVLGAFFIFVFILYKVFILFLGKVIDERFLYIYAKDITSIISAMILFVIYAYFFLNSYEPEYLSPTLKESMYRATNIFSSDCFLIDYILRLQSEFNAFVWFVMKNYVTGDVLGKSMSEFFWILFIIKNALSVLGINALINQTIYLIHVKIIRG